MISITCSQRHQHEGQRNLAVQTLDPIMQRSTSHEPPTQWPDEGQERQIDYGRNLSISHQSDHRTTGNVRTPANVWLGRPFLGERRGPCCISRHGGACGRR